jgi:DNA-binding MarR family transcriptional regulator/N-acetylglutamate synthase-like GNAT family acetyltransferase
MPGMSKGVPAEDVAGVRRFSRFYTRRIGVVERKLLGSPYTLAEARVLYEIANRPDPAPGEIGADLGLDAGYLSRILRAFERKGLVARRRSSTDARRHHLTLTPKGRAAFARLDARSRADVTEMLSALAPEARTAVVSSMATIETLLDDRRRAPGAVTLRAHRPGDMGWIVHRHASLYAAEYGWDERFAALVARITADFIDRFKPGRERCWIAEIDGRFAGCVFLVERSPAVAQLRMLLVEPWARGRGIGHTLVDECLAFARAAGYRRMMLWTNSVLVAARHIYESRGFTLTESERHTSFGRRLVGQTWERRL